MGMTGTGQVPSAVNNFYDRVMLIRAVAFFVHTNWAQIRDIPRNNSETIKFRRYGNLAAATNALSEGVTPTGSQLSITDITATVQQYGDFVTMTDKFLFTTLDPVLTETAEILGDQAGDTIDQLTRDVLAAGTTIQYASTATQRTDITAAMKMTGAEVREAVRTLQKNKARPITTMVNPSNMYGTVPLEACYVGIISPDTLMDLKSDASWVPVARYSEVGQKMPYEKGAVDEVRFVMTQNAKVFTAGGDGGVDVHATIILGQNAYGITRITGEAMRNIVKPLGSAGTSDPLDQRATSGWKATFVAKRLNDAFMIRIEHGVTA